MSRCAGRGIRRHVGSGETRNRDRECTDELRVGPGPLAEERVWGWAVPGGPLCDHSDPEDWRGEILNRGRDLVAGAHRQGEV